MPYMLEGNCVHKKNADGSMGEMVKCHESHEKAVNHMRALYANVHEGFHEFSMAIVKTSSKNGQMKWRSVNSDVDKDFFGENMSVELFRDFVRRIEDDEPFPEEFRSVICEEGWCGGMPYISLAHYKSGGVNKVNVPGEVQTLYVDGDKLKSTGTLYNTPLGQSVYRALSRDLEEKRKENKVRISIGFLDLEHTHGNFTFTRKSVADKCHLCAEGVGDKIYRKGVLVHLALTRIPANPRTDMEVEKSMTTKKDDLESIVDDPEVLKGLELKSQADPEILVVRNDDMDEDDKGGDTDPEEGKKKKKADKVEKSAPVEPVADPVASAPTDAPVAVSPAAEVIVAQERTALQKSLAEFEGAVMSLKSQGVYGDAALQKLQASFDGLADVVRSEVAPPVNPATNGSADIETTLRSLLSELLPQAIAQSVAPMQAELSELRALSLASKPAQPKNDFVPEPRSLNLNLTQRAAVEQIAQKSQFARLANITVGLPENTVR